MQPAAAAAATTTATAAPAIQTATNSERFRRNRLSTQPIRASPSAAGYPTNENEAYNPVGLTDEIDTSFMLSDDEKLAIALHSSLGPDSCQADNIILAGAPSSGTAQGTPEKAQHLKDLVRAKVSEEIDELVMKENSPNEGDEPDIISGRLDTMFSLRKRFRPERTSLDMDCEDMVRNGHSADHAYQSFANMEKSKMRREKKN